MTIKKEEDRPRVLSKRGLVGGGDVWRDTDKPSKAKKSKKADAQANNSTRFPPLEPAVNAHLGNSKDHG